MYRGRDEALRVYGNKKRFYQMKAEEWAEFEAEVLRCRADEGISEEYLARLEGDYERKKAELARLREETIAARRHMEDRLRRMDRQLCEVLYFKYVKMMSVTEICAKLCYSMQRIYQLLNKGVDVYCGVSELTEEARMKNA